MSAVFKLVGNQSPRIFQLLHGPQHHLIQGAVPLVNIPDLFHHGLPVGRGDYGGGLIAIGMPTLSCAVAGTIRSSCQHPHVIGKNGKAISFVMKSTHSYHVRAKVSDFKFCYFRVIHKEHTLSILMNNRYFVINAKRC